LRFTYKSIFNIESLQDLLNKHKPNEKFVVGCSDVSKEHEFFENNKFTYQKAVVYKTVSANVKDLKLSNYDLVCFFTPSGIRSLFENFPKFKQTAALKIGVFGEAAQRTAEAMGLKIDIAAPTKEVPSMPKAIEIFLEKK
jgi:uroporphyrinogen-III synthase